MAANTNIYFDQGGDALTVASGATLTVESGGTINIESGGTLSYNSVGTSRKLSSLTADGANFGGTGANAEAVMGSGTITIPASTLAAGDVVRFTAHVAVPTTVSTDTLRVRVRVGGVSGTAIFDSTAVDVANDDFFRISGGITFRTVGATGTALSVVDAAANVAGTFTPTDTQITALTDLDTTASLTVVVTAVWSTQSANVAKLQELNGYLN
jgi:hypothetical protein